MKKTKRSNKKEPKPILYNHIKISDIDNIQMLISIKGKDYILAPKKGQEKEAEIGMEISLQLALDNHVIVATSIQELEKLLKK